MKEYKDQIIEETTKILSGEVVGKYERIKIKVDTELELNSELNKSLNKLYDHYKQGNAYETKEEKMEPLLEKFKGKTINEINSEDIAKVIFCMANNVFYANQKKIIEGNAIKALEELLWDKY